jgi:hypothetical protein
LNAWRRTLGPRSNSVVYIHDTKIEVIQVCRARCFRRRCCLHGGVENNGGTFNRTVVRIRIVNCGTTIASSNYWGSENDRREQYFCSIAVSAVRLLVPTALSSNAFEWCKAKRVILSRGPWHPEGGPEGLEIFFEDHDNDSFAIQLTRPSFNKLPDQADKTRDWVFSAWVRMDEKPFKVFESSCCWRRLNSLPDSSCLERMTSRADDDERSRDATLPLASGAHGDVRMT